MKEGGNGSEGEERKRRAGVRERGGGEGRSSGQHSWSQRCARKQNKTWPSGASLQVAAWWCEHPAWEAQALGQAIQVLRGQDRPHRGPFLPSLVLLFCDVRLKSSKAFRGENKGQHEVEGMAR